MLFHIALKDLKIMFRDRKALAILLVMPALIMFILGSAFGNMFSSGPAIQKFSVGVVNKDDGLLSQVFINNVLRQGMPDMVETYVVSEEKANDMLKEKTVPSIVIIPENFSKDIEDNRQVVVEIKSISEGGIKSGIIRSAAGFFAQNISLGYAGAFAALDVFKRYNIPVQNPIAGMSDATALMADLQKKLSAGVVDFSEKNQEKERNTLSAIQYYSAAMLVMFLLFGASNGTKLIIEERESMTLGRILSSRAHKATLISGKFLGLFLICFVQAVILIAFTSLVYRVNWGPSILSILFVTLCAVFASTGFGMFIAAISRTPKMADGLSQLFIQSFTLVGGGMIPIYIMPEAMKPIAKVTLNWWAFSSYHNLMLGTGVYSVLPFCGILVLMGLVYLGIGITRFRI